MMRGLALVPAWCALLLAASAAAQSSLDGPKAEIAATLAKLEGEMVNQEAIGMNLTDLKYKFEALTPQLEDLNRRYDELNAYCRGEFEEPEYSRRVAYCDATASQLDTLKAQLQPEIDSVQSQSLELQRRATESDQNIDAIQQELTGGVTQLVLACFDLPVADQNLCQLPPAPGPRTADLVSSMNATLIADLLNKPDE